MMRWVPSRFQRLAAVVAATCGAAVFPRESLAQGCAMCATYLSGATDPRAYAFKVSIIFLMVMPFIVVGSAGGWIVWMHWRSRPPRPVRQAMRPEGEGAS
jgi:hypothetical protein